MHKGNIIAIEKIYTFFSFGYILPNCCVERDHEFSLFNEYYQITSVNWISSFFLSLRKCRIKIWRLILICIYSITIEVDRSHIGSMCPPWVLAMPPWGTNLEWNKEGGRGLPWWLLWLTPGPEVAWPLLTFAHKAQFPWSSPLGCPMASWTQYF